MLAVQCKWTETRSYLGPDVVNGLHGALDGYKQEEAGAYQEARGVIVTTAQMGSAAKQRAATHRIDYVQGFAPALPTWIRTLPSGRDRNRQVGDWYEAEVATWYEAQGYRIASRRGTELRKADGGIDLICVRG